MPIKRKKYIVNPRLQLALVIGANALAIIAAAVMITLAVTAKTHMENYVTGLNLTSNHPAIAVIAEREAEFDRVVVAAILIQFILFNVAAIFMSHRIAGPIHRLTRHLESVGEGGDPVDLKFRKDDFYAEVAVSVNKVMSRLRTLIAAK
jgi:methyl-accepting chemotaxis protein